MEEKDSQVLEDNLPMVNYIMLHRIYDMLTLMAKGSVGGEEVGKMIQYHKEGFLLGPSPSYSIEEKEENGD